MYFFLLFLYYLFTFKSFSFYLVEFTNPVLQAEHKTDFFFFKSGFKTDKNLAGFNEENPLWSPMA